MPRGLEALRVSVVVPTYNERDNIPRLLEEIDRSVAGLGLEYEVVVVDDSSPDGTAEVAEALSSRYPVRVVRRPGKMGLSSAVVEGARAARGELVVVMDADLQHPPALIPELLRKLGECDIAVASRYARGGEVEGFARHRALMSAAASLLARLAIPEARKTSDPMSGFFATRRELLAGLVPSEPRGYKVLLDLLAAAKWARVCDVPYVFRARERGRSKLGAAEVARFVLQLAKVALGLRKPRVEGLPVREEL